MQRASQNRASAQEKQQFPDKLFYKIGEVSRIARVEPYVLRYWESEFPSLRPRKNRAGQRVYVKKDLERILHIRDLLYDEKYTIEGVRLKLEAEGLKKTKEQQALSSDTLQYIKKRLGDILTQLS
ncbi:MAG: MerR family transcriptional regulator [Nitrospiraceae bacterium]|nr:MerR family transcriptional regulator [Nitrospiraceae bacterium]